MLLHRTLNFQARYSVNRSPVTSATSVNFHSFSGLFHVPHLKTFIYLFIYLFPDRISYHHKIHNIKKQKQMTRPEWHVQGTKPLMYSHP